MPASLTGLVNLCWRFCGDILSENDIVSVFLGLFSASPLKMLQWLACRIKKNYITPVSEWYKYTTTFVLIEKRQHISCTVAVQWHWKQQWQIKQKINDLLFLSSMQPQKNNKYLSLRFHSATVLYYKILFLFNVSLSSFLNRPHQIIRVFYASLCWL